MNIKFPPNSFLNTCEHKLNLTFHEILLLRNFCWTNGMIFCSTMGGCESIKDLEKSRWLGAEAIEFPIIESKYSLSKIFSSIDKVFLNKENLLKNYKLFINIGSLSGINILSVIKDFVLPNNLKKNNIIFIFNRVEISKDIYEKKDYKNEKQVNKFISDAIGKLNNQGFSHCISGSISSESLKFFNESNFNKPKFIKLGLFTIENNNEKNIELKKIINHFKLAESKLLKIMLDALIQKENHLRDRLKFIKDDIYG